MFANVTSVVALMVALSTGSAYAAGKIGPNDIQNNAVRSKHVAPAAVTARDLGPSAVTTAKIRNGAVGLDKLAAGNRPAHVTHFRFPGHDFGGQNTVQLRLPGVTEAQVRNSDWSATIIATDSDSNTVSIPVASFSTNDVPSVAVFYSRTLSGAYAFVADGNNQLDLFDVLGLRVVQTQRPTRTVVTSLDEPLHIPKP